MEPTDSPPPGDSAGTPYTAPPPVSLAPAGGAERDVRMWSTLCHLSALVGLLVPSIGAAIGPLVVWLLKRNDHPTIDSNGKEALNFQLSVLVYTWVLGMIGALTAFILVGFLFLGLAFLIGIGALVLAIIASIKVSNGQSYRYPLTIRFLN